METLSIKPPANSLLLLLGKLVDGLGKSVRRDLKGALQESNLTLRKACLANISPSFIQLCFHRIGQFELVLINVLKEIAQRCNFLPTQRQDRILYFGDGAYSRKTITTPMILQFL